MVFVKKTLADLLQNIADKHDSGILPTDSATLTYWTRLLNNAQQYCAEYLGLETNTSLTTVSGTIALPDDFKSIIDVVNSSNLKLIKISKDDSDGTGGDVYWITGSQTSGYYLNTASDETYTVYYTYNPAPLVNNTDICIVDDPMAVSLHAYAKIRQAETDPLEDAQTSLGEVERRLRDMMSDKIENDGGLMFTTLPNA
jgi:hypothetical protein